MSLIEYLKPPGPSGFGHGSTAEQVTQGLDLSGKTYLVTGCSSGMGLETARVLALRGAQVLATARTADKARAACAGLGLSPRIVPLACELADPASVRACVAQVRQSSPPLDGIICNAGIMALPQLQQAHGLELQFFTNHMGHFLLVTGLLEHLAPAGRVVVVSSDAHRRTRPGGIEFDNLSGQRAYAGWQHYGQSKLANLLFAKALARRLAGSGRTANALHPGVIATPLTRHLNPLMRAAWSMAGPLLLKSVAQGAATQCYVATHPSLAGVTGQYFADCNVAQPSAFGRDDALAERLWAVSEQLAAKLA